jgi:hypothetical protein
MGNVLKLVGGVPSSKLNAPPNNCMPSSAKIRMNKNSRNNREMMDLIELSNDITRFLSDAQYFVTLKMRSSLKALSTERPNDPDLSSDQTTSKIEPLMTTQSNLLNEDSKYILGPSAYIFTNISSMNSPKKTYSAISVNRNARRISACWTKKLVRAISHKNDVSHGGCP